MINVYDHMKMLSAKYKVSEAWIGAAWEYSFRPSLIFLENIIREYLGSKASENIEEYERWITNVRRGRMRKIAEDLCSQVQDRW